MSKPKLKLYRVWGYMATGESRFKFKKSGPVVYKPNKADSEADISPEVRYANNADYEEQKADVQASCEAALNRAQGGTE
jgi:hypothetical protein